MHAHLMNDDDDDHWRVNEMVPHMMEQGVKPLTWYHHCHCHVINHLIRLLLMMMLMMVI
jgi:hypothetical protein